MIRLRARFLAFVVSGLLASVAGAATIDVTTPYDITADNDNLCSLREAVTASELAGHLSRRKSSLTAAESAKTILETALLQIQEDPDNNSYPRGELLGVTGVMIDEVESFDTTPYDASLGADLAAFEDAVAALTTNATASYVEDAIALEERLVDVLNREIERLTDLTDVDGCTNGSAFDVVFLEEGVTYFLRNEVVVPARLTFRGHEGTRIAACSTTTECGGPVPTTGHRFIHFEASAVAEIYDITFVGGGKRGVSEVASGGALEIDGPVTLSAVVFEGNSAVLGGAVHVSATGTLTISESTFIGNTASGDGGAIAFEGGTLNVTGTTFGTAMVAVDEGNHAGGRGGALYFSPDDTGSALIERCRFIGNSAAVGSAVFHGGTDTGMAIGSSTLARNEASNQATIAVEATGDDGVFLLNSVTLTENTALVGTAGVRVTALEGVRITNTLLVGNDGGGAATTDDCDFGVLALDSTEFRRNFYLAGSTCPGAVWPSGIPEYDNYFEVASRDDVVGYLVEPLDVDEGHYIPLYPVTGDLLPRLVSRGASAQDVYRCTDQDQRNKERISSIDSDCDVGAIEYQMGRRADDVINILVDERTCLDVVANDIGDANYIARSLIVFGADRAGASMVIASADPAAYLLAHPGATVVDLATCPNAADLTASEAILFTPPAGFRGEVLVTYGLEWETDTDGDSTTSGGDISGRARVLLESRGGIASSSIGASGPLWLLVLGVLGLRRRCLVRGGVFAALLIAGTAAHALDNVIYVNSGLDEPFLPTAGDGKCTLREALMSARNDQANLTGGDCLDGIEGPDTIEFASTFIDTPGGVTTVTLNDSLIAYGSITLRCPQAADGEVQQVCTIQRVETVPPALPTRRFRLIDSRGSITVQRMVLEGGYPVDSDPMTLDTGKEGGAIYSTGAVAVVDSTFRNNVASAGGAIFLSGVRAALAITRSVFEGNRSTNDRAAGAKGGGVVATTQSDDHKITIEASTFSGNESVGGAAVLNLNSTNTAVIVNSTFSGNRSTQGAGVMDVSGVRGSVVLRNLTIVDNVSGVDPAAEPWDVSPPPTQRSAIEAGGRSIYVTSNIIAANFDLLGLLDQNCGAGLFASLYNLYGGSDCSAGTGDSFLAPTDVYDSADPVGSGLLGPLEDIGIGTKMHLPHSPLATVGVIVDAGYKATGTIEENQVAPLELTERCATIDQRGASRASGGRCDRGAYEFLSVTAIDDKGNNVGRKDRIVIVDFAGNDVFDALDLITDNDLKADCDFLDTSTPGHVLWREGSATGDICIDVTLGAVTGTVSFLRPGVDEEVLELETESPYVLRYDNGGAIALKDKEDDGAGPLELTYVVYANDQAIHSSTTSPAKITIEVDNVPPWARNDEVTIDKGQTVSIDLLANDEDFDAVNPALNPMTIKKISCKAVTDINDPGTIEYWQCAFGKVWLNGSVITYKPDNSFNPFRDTFTYEVSDNDPDVPKEATATVVITTHHADDSGGGLLGENDLSNMLGIDWLGAPGHLFLVSLVLSLARRRRRG